MAKTDLPREAHRKPLDYDRLVSTLEMIDGEPVIVRLSPREADSEPVSGAASIVGALKHQVPALLEGHEFSIGSPYPDRNPEHLAGGILFLNEGTFESATLTTFDGNGSFIISIQTRCMEILVQDGDSTYLRPTRSLPVTSTQINLARRRESLLARRHLGGLGQVAASRAESAEAAASPAA